MAARGVRQGALDAAAAAGLARRHGASGVEVELIDGEEGVAPGQACVFYDARDGQARVLGGGFIKSVAAPVDVPAARTPQRAQAAVRG